MEFIPRRADHAEEVVVKSERQIQSIIDAPRHIHLIAKLRFQRKNPAAFQLKIKVTPKEQKGFKQNLLVDETVDVPAGATGCACRQFLKQALAKCPCARAAPCSVPMSEASSCSCAPRSPRVYTTDSPREAISCVVSPASPSSAENASCSSPRRPSSARERPVQLASATSHTQPELRTCRNSRAFRNLRPCDAQPQTLTI